MAMRELKIEVEQLSKGPIEKDFDFLPSFFELEDDPDFRFPERLTGSITARRAGTGVVVTGRLETVVEAACVRCLGSLRIPMSVRLDMAFMPEDPQNPPEDPEEAAKRIWRGDFLYPMEQMREELMVALPALPSCGLEDPAQCEVRAATEVPLPGPASKAADPPEAPAGEKAAGSFAAKLAEARRKLPGGGNGNGKA